MATRGKHGNDKKETFLEVVAAVTFSIAVVVWMVWFFGSHKIVYYFTPFLRVMAVPWYYIDPELWGRINDAYVQYRLQPKSVPLALYIQFANACLKPFAVAIGFLSAIYIGSLFISNKDQSTRRRLKPMETAREISKVFPAIIPVLHLGPKLIKNELPLWRRQTFPEEVWKNELVDRRPMVEKGVLHTERVATYFRGGESAQGKLNYRGGRRWSKMLGYQVVDLINDRGKLQNICFADRFSPQGKVIFALLCAHAFGGREGKKDYKKATDTLNRSCAGQADGIPNLTVVQWLYDKYRANEVAKKLFAVHHWEYSYLFAIFFKAKLTGKATHTDFIWLKPLDRILFYALNTVGRSTPPVESAAVFSQYDYEVRVAKAKRLPLVHRADGSLVHHIAIGTAVDGLKTEFTRYNAAFDDADDWWKDLKTWRGADVVVQQLLRDSALRSKQGIATAQTNDGSAHMTEFDQQMIEKAAAIEEKLRDEELLRIRKSLGISGSGIDLDLI